MNGLRGFFKAAQRHTFTLLNTRWGFLLLVVASLLCFNAAISSIDAFFHISELPLPAQYDNIAGKDFSEFVCGEPIDVVYTWVNGSDPWMQYNLRRYRALAEMMPGEVVNGTAMEEEEASIEEGSDTGKSRYQDNQELRYSIRSVERFAGWVRHIYLVTNGQVPHWLNVDHPKITVVPHHDLYPNKSHLPVFASPTIESHLHRIPGLSRRFIYLNDDTFFGKTIHPDDFATHTEGHRVFLSWAVPNCAEGCPGTWVADGYCDKPCNTSECDWDGGDCVGANVKQGVGAPSSSHVAPGPPGEPTGCSSGCVPSWVGDKFCDRNCNNRECGYDATDCSLDDLRTLPMIHAGYDEYVLDADEPAAVMNLTAVFDEHSRVTSGSHDSSELLWTTTVSQLHKMLVIVVKTHRFASVRRPHTATVHFDLLGKEGDGTDIWYSFNVTLVARNGTHEDLDDYLPEERQAYQRQRSTGGDATSLDSAPLDTIPEEGPRRKLQQWSGVQLRESTSVRNSIGVLEGFTADDVAVATARRGLKGKVEAQEYVKEALSRLVPPRGTETTEWRRMKRRRLAQKLLQREMQRHEEEASWKRIESFWAFVEGTSPEPSDSPSPNGRRLLLDMFGESLKYANRLMNARFGNAARKVPSHMPHFLNQDVLREVQDAWKKEYEATSASRFRAGNNMQLAFTHMYWLMHAKNEKNAFLLFLDNLDINGNGLLDVLEYRRAAVILWEKKVPLEDLKAVFDSPAAAPSNRTGENATLTSTATATMTVVDEPSELTMSMMTPAVEMTPVVQETNVYGVTEGDVDRVLPEDDGGDANTTEAGDLPPLLCRNETVAGANGSEVVREICEREVPKMATVETPAPTLFPPVPQPAPWTPPPEAEEPTMSPEYFSTVTRLIELAASGVGLDRPTIRPSATGLLTPLHFNGSHLASFLLRGDAEPRYRFTLMDEEEISFFMIRDNETVVQRQMDHMMYKRAKFMCINDNMNHSSPNNDKVLEVLQTFLRSYFPWPSSFEHPPGKENPFLHTWEAPPHLRQKYGWSDPTKVGLSPSYAATFNVNRETGETLWLPVNKERIVYGLVALVAALVVLLLRALTRWCCRRRTRPPIPSGLLV